MSLSIINLLENVLQPTAWKRFLFFFLSDIILFYLSLLFALLFHFDLNLNIRYNPLIFPVLPFFVAVKIGSFVLFRIYKMTWRYVGLYDLLSISAATVIAAFLLMLSVLLPVDLPLSGFSKGVVLADGIITLFLISGLRVSKRIYEESGEQRAESIEKRGTAPDLFSLPSLECHGCRSGGRTPFPQQTGK